MTSNNDFFSYLNDNIIDSINTSNEDTQSSNCFHNYQNKCNCFDSNTHFNGNNSPWDTLTFNTALEDTSQKFDSLILKPEPNCFDIFTKTENNSKTSNINLGWSDFERFDTFNTYPNSSKCLSSYNKIENENNSNNYDSWNNYFITETQNYLNLKENSEAEPNEIYFLNWFNDDSEYKSTGYNLDDKFLQDSNNTNYLNETTEEYKLPSKPIVKNDKTDKFLYNDFKSSDSLKLSKSGKSHDFYSQDKEKYDPNKKTYFYNVPSIKKNNNGKTGFRMPQMFIQKSNDQQFILPKIDGLMDYSLFASKVNCEIGTTERHGGLTWNRHSNNVLLPYIENTWLKHMIDSLKDKPDWYERFFSNLERCLKDAVTFLYRQGIKPYLGDVANQMKRSVADNFWSAAEVAYVSIKCKDIVKLRIELRVKGEMGWVVYLADEPEWFKGFVNTHSTEDNYSPYHWRTLNKFAVDIVSYNNAKNGDLSTVFSGGRYAFAERLKEQVEAFKDMRLGQVVHLVQLAIYNGIFVYAQRILLPVTACEKTAEEIFPRQKKVRYPVCMSIREVVHIISLLVDHRRNGMVLAQLKQQFMLQFNRELNPMYFGYRKLQNLLISETFSPNYILFVPIDSPHRTHLQNKKYPIPNGCRIFQQSKLAYDPKRCWTPMDDWYDQTHDLKNETIIANMPEVVESVINSIEEVES